MSTTTRFGRIDIPIPYARYIGFALAVWLLIALGNAIMLVIFAAGIPPTGVEYTELAIVSTLAGLASAIPATVLLFLAAIAYRRFGE